MDGMPTIRGPGEVVLLQRAACLHIKYENEQGRGICKQGRDGLCSPMPNECIYLAVRKLFSFPHAQILLAFFPRTSCVLARAYGVLVRKSMARRKLVLDSGLQVRVRESPANADAAWPLSSVKSLAV
jgi:hypothetical protein